MGISDPVQQFDEELIRYAWAPASEAPIIPAIGFTGSEGGQYTVIPSPTEPGTYRICAASEHDVDTTLCSAPFEVVSS